MPGSIYMRHKTDANEVEYYIHEVPWLATEKEAFQEIYDLCLMEARVDDPQNYELIVIEDEDI